MKNALTVVQLLMKITHVKHGIVKVMLNDVLQKTIQVEYNAREWNTVTKMHVLTEVAAG